MTPRSLFYYEARVGLGPSALLPALALPLYALLEHFTWHEPGSFHLIRAFEVILPLTAALAACHLMAVEREEGISELRATYPEPRWRLPALRSAGALALALLALLAGMLCFRLTSGPFSLAQVVTPALAPALFLVGAALLVSNLTGSYWATAGTVMGYWFLEVLSRGRFTQTVYLFQKTWPLPDVDLVPNRLWLAGLGFLFLAANAAISLSRRAGV